MKVTKLKLGILLTIMMFAHNFVLNQPQSLQEPLQKIHHVQITEFNLLYSVPSALAILIIIPMGILYDKYSNALLILGAIALSVGQLLIFLFGGEDKNYYFYLLMIGRIFEWIGAQVLYMIQGNMASSWMGRSAGIVFIFPEFGEIANVFITPWAYLKWGVQEAFFIGFITCLCSSISCFMIYCYIKEQKKSKHTKEIQMNQVVSDNIQEPKTTSPEDQNIHKISEIDKNTHSSQHASDTEGLTSNKITIFSAGKIFWWTIFLCAINQCLYFPFLDNANELIRQRFCIAYENTGYYLSIPFISAMLTSGVSSYLLTKIQRSKLILLVSVIPLIGHGIIFLDENCLNNESTFLGEMTLIIGLSFFGMGIGSYYSVSFPGVGLSVPEQIRGTAYACMGFFQTISMTMIPILSGLIVEFETKVTKLSEGYKESSLLFVAICITGVIISYIIFDNADEQSFMYDDEDNFMDEDEEHPKQYVDSWSEEVTDPKEDKVQAAYLKQ